MSTRWGLVPPENFDGFDWVEAEFKGVLFGAHLEHGGRRFPVTLYDRFRLGQDVEAELASGPFYEPNIVLLPKVTEAAAEREIDRLAREEQLDWMLALTAEPETTWALDVPESLDWAVAGRHGVAPLLLGHRGRRFLFRFYNPARVAQVTGMGSEHDFRLYEKNLVVLLDVTRESVRRAVEVLGRHGRFRWLLDQ